MKTGKELQIGANAAHGTRRAQGGAVAFVEIWIA